MPQIIFKGVNQDKMEKISGELAKELAVIMDTPEDWFVFENANITFFVSGKKTIHYPMVDVLWFDRGQEIKDKAALAIDKSLRNEGYEEIEIAFHSLIVESYYENGKHY